MKHKHHRKGWIARLIGMIAGDGCEETRRWRCDPLAHPELRNMTPDQLADLPIGPEPNDCGGRCR